MWVLLALGVALATAAREALVKSVMRDGDEVAVAFLVAAVAASLLLPVGLAGAAEVHGSAFWRALLVSGGINAAAFVMIARAVHVSDLSLVSPLQSTTPLFMLVTGPLLIGELPGGAGIAGIGVITAGAYVLNIGSRHAGPLEPLRALLRDRGARLFLGVAALWSVSGVVDKIGVQASTPLLWAGALNAFVALSLAAVLVATGRLPRVRHVVAAAPVRSIGAGVIMAAGIAAQMTALTLTFAAYVIAVKRTSILFSVIAGALLFRERAAAARITGAIIIITGLMILTVYGK